MPVITVKHKGDFKLTKKFLARIRNRDYTSILEEYGQKGVKALSSATPVGTGETAASWFYEIERNGDTISLASPSARSMITPWSLYFFRI